jgi:nitrogen fixation NifU-like protein
MMSAGVKGRPLEEVRKLIRSFKSMMSIHEHSLGGDDAEGEDETETVSPDDLGELAALQGVVKFPVRIKCATLSWNALAQGLDEIAAGVPSGG